MRDVEDGQDGGSSARRRIVVGIDGIDASVAALRWAVRQARMTGARVQALMAWEVHVTVMLSPSSTEEDSERDVLRLLEATVTRAGVRAGEDVDTTLVQWRAGPALVRAAQEAELLVVGSHRYGAISGMHIGSVADFCVNHAPCPVLVHRVTAESVPGAVRI